MAGLNNLNWDDLRVFLAVARMGAISRAARHLGMDHSTISRRISQLEYVLGASLFERQSNGLSLNRLGQDMLERAEAVERNIIGMEEHLTGRDAEIGGVVRIAMMEGIASLYLSRRLLGLTSHYPGLTLEIITSPQHVQVSRREADLFLSFFQANAKSVTSKKVGEFGLGLFAAPEYLEHHGTPHSLSDLTGHVFVDYVRDLIHIDPVRWLDDVISEPRIAVTSSSMIAQMGCAVGGMGLVLLPYFAVEQETRLLRVLEGVTDVRREIWLTVHNDLRSTGRIKAVERYISELLRADRDYLLGCGPAVTRPGATKRPQEQARTRARLAPATSDDQADASLP
ncbi:MAG: LysR family transcriptional regulator [Xanthobacter sp.]